ncbi:MAG: hypothetical protein WCI27_11720, partial [Candidatus Omnitrophota bacterium]
DRYDQGYLDRILQQVRKILLAHLQKGPQVFERLRTTMFWYFREVLRWGSHSRVAMRYDRRCLEYCMEALVVAAVLDDKMAAGRNARIMALAAVVAEVVKVHEAYCVQVDLDRDSKDLLVNYAAVLKSMQGRLLQEETA